MAGEENHFLVYRHAFAACAACRCCRGAAWAIEEEGSDGLSFTVAPSAHAACQLWPFQSVAGVLVPDLHLALLHKRRQTAQVEVEQDSRLISDFPFV